jgi:hypothetical protein
MGAAAPACLLSMRTNWHTNTLAGGGDRVAALSLFARLIAPTRLAIVAGGRARRNND